jgi:Ni/Fe-hydrogenase 1 B-type cytochrome subunit
METLYKSVYVWEFPVRFTHWLNMIAVLVLGITGYYIGNPFIHAYRDGQYVMGWMRFIHFSSAYFLLASIIIRVYWSFAGNPYASWRAFFPFTQDGATGIVQQVLFYSFLTDKPRFAVGHNPLAGLYYLIMAVTFLVELATGFALYSLSSPGGIMRTMFGWVFSVFSIPMTRLIHHLTMWALVYFVILHVYIAFYLDRVENSNLIGSMYTGYKNVHQDVKVKR